MAAPTPESIRATMAIPSTDRMRGLRDGVGFATTPEAMAAVYEASAQPPHPLALGPAPSGPVVGAICPHDDFLYAGRVYRRALERIEAKTVIVVGVFHAHKKFGANGPILDDFESWWTPDGPVRVSALREWILDGRAMRGVDSAAHEHEHSIEPIAAWLRHRRPDVEILPILAPATAHDYMSLMAAMMIARIFEWMQERELMPGRDVAIVISADAIHYGADFGELRFGLGDATSYELATAEDRRILREVLDPRGTPDASFRMLEALVDDPWRPDAYRWTWCGRYSIPFGLCLLEWLSGKFSQDLRSWPLAYETSLSAPPLEVSMPPLGFTAPASYEHFVGYPAVAFTFEPRPRAREI